MQGAPATVSLCPPSGNRPLSLRRNRSRLRTREQLNLGAPISFLAGRPGPFLLPSVYDSPRGRRGSGSPGKSPRWVPEEPPVVLNTPCPLPHDRLERPMDPRPSPFALTGPSWRLRRRKPRERNRLGKPPPPKTPRAMPLPDRPSPANPPPRPPKARSNPQPPYPSPPLPRSRRPRVLQPRQGDGEGRGAPPRPQGK